MIPFSFTQINNTNNILFGFIGATPWSVIVPEGNYNINELITTVKGLIQTVAGVTLTWTYDRATSKTTLVYTAGTGTLTLDYASSVVIMEMFGFTQNVVLTVGQTKVSDQGVNVNPVQNLYIRSSTLNQPDGKEFLLAQNETSDIIAKVPVNVTPYSFINYDNSSYIGVRLSNRTLDAIELYLSTNQNYVLSLNGQPWTCMLNFTEIVLPIQDDAPTVQNILREIEPLTRQQQEARLDELKQQREALVKELEDEKKKILASIKDNDN